MHNSHTYAHSHTHTHTHSLTHAHTHALTLTLVPESQLFNRNFFSRVALVQPVLCSRCG